jgi:hypothetical protein
MLVQTQRECDKNTAVAEEAMQAAASEVSAVTEQLDKEAAARESLEGTVRELERKLVIERQKSKMSSEWMTNRKQWQAETNNLIASIQQECNTVFAQNIVRTESPRSVAVSGADESSSMLDDVDLSKIEGTADVYPVHKTPWKRETRTSYKSPLDVSQALDETEALVRSLVGN